MIVQQFFVPGLAHSSYLLGGNRICAVIDPRRDVGIYLDAAKALGLRITHVLETHLHADFVSGHLDLADATGARIVAPASAACRFEHVSVAEGDSLELEDMTVRVLETPGHTPEHVSYVVVDNARGAEPAAVFCGDTLFVGDVGRPDLFPGRARELAEKLFESLHGKLLRLPDFCEVYPAHGAGSLCGRAMGAKRTSTIGYERLYNPALKIFDRDEFVRSLTTHMPAAPDHFGRCSAVNGAGPARAAALASLEPLEPRAFRERAAAPGALVLDTRSYGAFGGQHVPGAYHIDLGGNFSTFAGWVLPPEREVLLVADGPDDAREAATLLRRVGLDRAVGYLAGGMFEWAKAGLPSAHVAQLSAPELHERIARGEPLSLVDVRAPAEFEAGHVQGALNIPTADLRTRHSELPGDRPVVLVCSTGHRSSLGASLLLQRGFSSVTNAAGGMTGYGAAGFSGECPVCVVPHGPRYLGQPARA